MKVSRFICASIRLSNHSDTVLKRLRAFIEQQGYTGRIPQAYSVRVFLVKAAQSGQATLELRLFSLGEKVAMPTFLKTKKAQVYALFGIVMLGAALGNMSQTALNTLLPDVVRDLAIEVGVGQWLTTIYMLVFGIVVPLSSFLHQRFSMRQIVFASLLLSLIGLTLAMLAQSFEVLIVGRVCQAIATGVFMPVLQTLAMTRFPANQRATAMGVAGIALGVAPSAGPSLSGLVEQVFGWHAFFAILLGITAILTIAALFLLRADEPGDKTVKLDIWSFLLSAISFGGLLLAFSDASSFSLANPFVWGPLIIGILALIVFVLRQRKISSPLIHMNIFKSKQYVIGFIVLCLLFTGYMGVMIALPLYVIDLCSGTPANVGIMLAPGILVSLIISPLAGFLTDKLGIRPVTIAAGLLYTAGMVAMVFVDEHTSFLLILIIQTVRTIGVAGLIGPVTSWSLAKLPHDIVADGSSFMLAVRQVFGSLGTAVMVFIITTSQGSGSPQAIDYQLSFAFAATLAILLLLIVFIKVKKEKQEARSGQ